MTTKSGRRLGILLSGRGCNFLAIADSIATGRLDAEIAIVISNLPVAPGIIAACERGLNARVIASRGLEHEVYDRTGAFRKISDRRATRGRCRMKRLGLLALIGAWFLSQSWQGLNIYFTDDDLMNTYGAWILPPAKLAVANLTPFTSVYRPLGSL